jgi:phospholipid/cholesterol/gamma-HCH transport system substrate-binding protein
LPGDFAVSRTLTRSQAVLLGAVVLAGLGLGTLGLFAIGQRQWLGGGAFHVSAGFPDIGGVEVGTRVRVQGIDAGEVEAIVPPATAGGNVALRLRLAGRFRPLVRADSRVQIVREGMLAGKVVRILPGSPGAEPVADDAVLAAQPAADLNDGLAQATAKLQDVLGQVDGTLREFRDGKGPAGQMTAEITQATAKLNHVLRRVDATLEAVQKGEGTLGQLLTNDSVYGELTGTLGEVKGALQEIRGGEGTLGKLVKTNEAYDEALQSLQDVRRMVTSVKQNADAIKALPVVRSYVVDANKELIRPDCKRDRKSFAESQLFEPGRAVLTDQGRRHLDALVPWLKDHKEPGNEVLVAAFAAPNQNPDFAHTLTQKQAEAVCAYLRDTHRVHRTGFWWWSTRRVRSLGCGSNPPPVPETERLPPARVEVLVFVPQR